MLLKPGFEELTEFYRKDTVLAVVEREYDDEETVIGKVELFIVGVPGTFSPEDADYDRQAVKDALVAAWRVNVGDRPWRNRTLLLPKNWPDEIERAYRWDECEMIAYDDLLMEAIGERKLPLSLPILTLAALSKMAQEGGQSLEDYCETLLSRHATLGQETTEISQRDAMRALHRMFGGDKDAIINGWVRLNELRLVKIMRNPRSNPPLWYAQQLYQDATSKGWLDTPVPDSVVQAVREALQEKTNED